MSRVLYLITKHHEWGCNILGLLLVGVSVLSILAAVQCFDAGLRVLGGTVFFLGIIAVTVVDFVWRYCAGPRNRLWRFVLPSCGGAMLFVPMWLYFPAAFVAGTIAMAIRAIRGN